MKNLIIIGTGGFGKELYSFIKSDMKKNFLTDCIFKGFIDDDQNSFLSLGVNESYLGSVDEYSYKVSDHVLVAIGNIGDKNRIICKLNERGVKFFTYIHSSVFVSGSAKIGNGVIVCPFSVIQANSTVEDHCVLNIYCSIGHDSKLGANSILSPYSTLNGNVSTAEGLFMGTRSTILLGSVIGNNCIISSHTTVQGKLENNLMVKDKVNQIQVKNRLI